MLIQIIRQNSALAFTLLLLSLAVLFSNSVFADNSVAKKQMIQEGWSYYWGDLPKKSNAVKNQTTVTDINDLEQWNTDVQWQPAVAPLFTPEQKKSSILWLKKDLPQGNWRDPYLFVSSIDLTVQVFQNNQLIYQFGQFDEQGNSQFFGWPWHNIRLPVDYSEAPIYFRVFSDYHYIGLSGDVAIGERFSLLSEVYERGFTGFLFILVVLVVGFISTIMGTIKKDSSVAICTGLLSFNLALMMFAENELSQVVWFNPLFWRYVAAFSYFLVPVFLSIIVISWFKNNSPKTAFSVLILSSFFVVSIALLSIFTDFNFVNAYPYFDVLFIFLVLGLFIGCFNQFKQVGVPGVIMTMGIFALFISLLLDMLSAHLFIEWLDRTAQWGLILFTLTSLAIYLVRDWKQQIALTKLTDYLETEVEVRTKELRTSKQQLEQMAREDFLTSLLNRRAFSELALTEIANASRYKRPLSLLLFDIDHFKDINDQYGHSVGDLVLKAIAKATKDTCRGSELICRYGGEEFVILLHSTEVETAKALANRLREAINNIEVKTNEFCITITASFGLISLDNIDEAAHSNEQILERLLGAADKLMYEVKVSGRDAIKTRDLSMMLDVN